MMVCVRDIAAPASLVLLLHGCAAMAAAAAAVTAAAVLASVCAGSRKGDCAANSAEATC
jgi:hypothetical protein